MGRSSHNRKWSDDENGGLAEGAGRQKLIILGVNGVAVDRYGLILWENEATGSRKVFKYLLGLREAIKNSKMPKNIKNQKICFFVYS